MTTVTMIMMNDGNNNDNKNHTNDKLIRISFRNNYTYSFPIFQSAIPYFW